MMNMLVISFCVILLLVTLLLMAYLFYTNIKKQKNKKERETIEMVFQKTFETNVKMLECFNDAHCQQTDVFDKLNQTIMNNYRMLTKLQIAEMIQNHPEEVSTICELYENYKAVGGNSFVDKLYDEWMEPKNKKK